MGNLESFIEVIEAGPDQLHEIVCKAGDSLLSDPHAAYAAAIRAFRSGEFSWLKSFSEQVAVLIDSKPELRPLYFAVLLRYELQGSELTQTVLAESEAIARSDSFWAGEFCMLLGWYHEKLSDPASARFWYITAIAALEKTGAKRKAVRAMFNSVVMETRLQEQRNFISRYNDIFRRAMRRDIRETTVAGLCLLNISRDYQDLGATQAAMKYCNLSLQLLEREFGSVTHYQALTHRCHLYLELGRISDARQDYEQAKAAPFAEIVAILKVLENAFQPDELAKVPSPRGVLPPTWAQRREQWIQRGGPTPTLKLSQLEQRLVRLLSKKALPRLELISLLYGERLEASVRINRFQSLLSTLRKKRPGLVIYESGVYKLTDTLFVSDEESA